MQSRCGRQPCLLSLLLGGMAMILLHHDQARADLGVLVPAYFAPWVEPGKTDWDRLASAAEKISVTAIMTADKGLGIGNLLPEEVASYQGVVGKLQAAGGTAIGYVPTDFGKADIAAVQSQVQYYFDTFGVNGIFLDEMSQLSTTLGYYTELYDFIRSKGGSVFGNPGIPFDDVPKFVNVADNLVIYEGPLRRDGIGGPSFLDTTRPDGTIDPGYPYGLDWFQSQPSSKITNLVYSAETVEEMTAAIHKAVRNNAGFVYVTDDDLPNPWDRLPTYWDEQVALIASVPEPSSVLLAATGALAGMLVLRRRDRRSGP